MCKLIFEKNLLNYLNNAQFSNKTHNPCKLSWAIISPKNVLKRKKMAKTNKKSQICIQVLLTSVPNSS